MGQHDAADRERPQAVEGGQLVVGPGYRGAVARAGVRTRALVELGHGCVPGKALG